MAKTCTIIKAGRADTYGRPLLVGQSYTGPDDEVFSLWQTGFATVDGAPGAFLPATAIRQLLIAAIEIPFVIMPGDGAANGCQFTGTNGTFTLSAAIIANIGTSLAGCYAYFSANFGGSSLPAGWYWTEFSSDTEGIVYAETYTSGKVSRPGTKTAITPNLSGWVTATTNEVVGPTGFVLPGGALGKNGVFQAVQQHAGSVSNTKTYRVKVSDTNVVQTATTVSPVGGGLYVVSCIDSHTAKFRSPRAIGTNTTTYASTSYVSVDTSVDQTVSMSLQGSTNVAAPILMSYLITTAYGE